jgi:methionyl-tRNA formyltransferase
MRAVLLSRYPRVDTPAWKRRVGDRLLAAGTKVAVCYSRATLRDQAAAGLREEGLGVFRRYTELRSGSREDEPRTSRADWAEARGLTVKRMRRLDDPAPLRRLSPDVVLLLGADIVPASWLTVPRLGTVNAHYGLLPAYRGMNVTEWSIYQGDPLGVTIHLVDSGVDTGPILVQEQIALEPGDTFASLRRKHQEVAARLLVDAALALLDGSARAVPQAAGQGRQYYRMHPALRRVAETRLGDQAARVGARTDGARSSTPSNAAAASTSPSAT